MKAYAGIDLHSSNSYIGIIDEQNQRQFGKRLPNSLSQILVALEPYREDLEAVVVESTYNWYWLVDGLQQEGYKVNLANPSAIKQYEGLKHTDDKWDAFWLAQMKHLNILPEGYIYPKEDRPVRDLLRRRLLFVRQRTSQILSLQSAIERNLSLKISGNAIKKLKEEEGEDLFDSPYLALTAKSNIAVIQFLTKRIKLIEKAVKSEVELRKEFHLLKTIPGIGDILTLTIMLEVGDIGRFPKVGNYSSYCRCVKSEKLSNGKKKVRTTRRMVTSTYPGHMWRQQTSPLDFRRKRKSSISERWPRRTV
jgi:Transposase and inactivated derivatives